jgi:cysteine desulfurase
VHHTDVSTHVADDGRAPAGSLERVTIYLDHAGSSPMVPAAVAAMTGWMESGYGNPSGSHSVARRARQVVEDARDVVAAFMGVSPAGVVFTSGGTESDNLGVLGPLPSRAGALVVSAVEHPAVMQAARSSGREVRILGVGEDGVVDLEHLRLLAGPDVAVVSVQMANHETGVIQPVEDVARRVRKWAPNAVLHTDAVQAAPWLDLTSQGGGVDLISISGHKFGGPQGVGALGIRGDVEIAARQHGGGQERERRSGTLNVAAIAGLAAAVETLVDAGPAPTVADQRDLLARLVIDSVPGTVITGSGSPRLPGHCHFRFEGVESEALLFLLDEAGVCASAGAACASGAIEPSPVILAMGVDKVDAGGSLRCTLGRRSTEAEVRAAADVVVASVRRLRGA